MDGSTAEMPLNNFCVQNLKVQVKTADPHKMFKLTKTQEVCNLITKNMLLV